MEIAFYFKKKEHIFFDNSVVLKSEIARLFIESMNIDVDENFVVTACMLYSCKKNVIAHDYDEIKRYAKDGAEYLETLGFSKKFCKICSEVNRYFDNGKREKESDILEIIDIFGGLVLDRPERKGYPIDEAMNLIETRNLRDVDNIYVQDFKKFIYLKEGIKREYGEVHTSDSLCNPDVERAIRIAKLTKGSTAECIKHMYGETDAVELSAEKEAQRIEIRKKDLGREDSQDV